MARAVPPVAVGARIGLITEISADNLGNSGHASLTAGKPPTYIAGNASTRFCLDVAHPLLEGASIVNKQDLVNVIAESGDLSKAKAGDVLDAVFDAVQEALKKKEEVRLVGFGTFSTSGRKAGKGRNPRTGEEITIEATTTVRFKAGKALKDAVN